MSSERPRIKSVHPVYKAHSIDDILAEVRAWPTSKKNRKMFTSFLNIKASNVKILTLNNYATLLRVFARWLGKHEAKTVTADDLARFLNEYGKGKSKATINGMKITLKTFYRWMNGGETPKCVKGFKIKTKDNRAEIQTKDLPTSDEKLRIVRAADGERDTALLTFYDGTGARPEEPLMLDVCDLDLTNLPDYISTGTDEESKKGIRDIWLTGIAAVAMERWLRAHPLNKKGTNWPNVPLFTSKRDPNRRLTIRGADLALKKACERVGTRRFPLKVFGRIAAATDVAGDPHPPSQEAINYKFGWERNSNMFRHYSRQAKEGLKKAWLARDGITTPEVENRTRYVIIPETCPRCEAKLVPGDITCDRCNVALTPDGIEAAKADKPIMDGRIARLEKALAALEARLEAKA